MDRQTKSRFFNAPLAKFATEVTALSLEELMLLREYMVDHRSTLQSKSANLPYDCERDVKNVATRNVDVAALKVALIGHRIKAMELALYKLMEHVPELTIARDMTTTGASGTPVREPWTPVDYDSDGFELKSSPSPVKRRKLTTQVDVTRMTDDLTNVDLKVAPQEQKQDDPFRTEPEQRTEELKTNSTTETDHKPSDANSV